MTKDCGNQYECPATRVNIQSELDGAGDCCVEVASTDDKAHLVSLWNLGSGSYVVDVEGSCEEPLVYAKSKARAWNHETIDLPPTLKAEAVPFRWKIEAEDQASDGLLDREISAFVRITERLTRGGRKLQLDQQLPPNTPLAFRCRVQ